MASCKGRVCLGRENICKNCIKEDVCKIAEDFYKKPVYGMYIEDCDYFKDSNKFVELPCKVGDKVYYFSDSNYKKYEVCKIVGFHIDKYRTAFKIELCGYKCIVDTEFLGEKIFLTREEAEQALKERENNG